MEIDKITRKQRWKRLKPTTLPTHNWDSFGVNTLYDDDDEYGKEYWTLSQADLLREYEPTAHSIYQRQFATFLPKYEWDETLNGGQGGLVIRGQHKLWQSAVAIQKEFAANRAFYCFGNEIWIGTSDPDEAVQGKAIKVKEMWEKAKMKAALIDFWDCCCGLGDSAIYIFTENGKINYKVFRYDNGDYVGEYHNPITDERIGWRKYNYEGRRACELYYKDRMELWIHDRDDDDNPLGDIIPDLPADARWSDDNSKYRLVKTKEFITSQSTFLYFRRQDTVTGPVQKNIEDYEIMLSDGLENQLYFVFPMLFLKGLAIDAPEIGQKGITLVSEDPVNGDAKLLSPPDVSNIYTINLKNTLHAICDGSFNPRIRIEDFSGQSDSAARFQFAFFSVLVACEKDYATLKHFLTRMLEVFSELVGILEGDMSYASLDLTYMFSPRIPTNEATFIDGLQKMVQVGAISQETAAEELDFANANEYERLKREGKVSTPEDRINEVAALSQATQPGTTELVVGESLQE